MKEQSNLVFLPGWIEQLKPLLGPMMPDFLRSYEMPPVRGLRVRPGLPPPPEAQEKVPWAENGYYIPLDSAALLSASTNESLTLPFSNRNLSFVVRP